MKPHENDDDERVEPARRPYEAPRITSSEAFERLALDCNGGPLGQPVEGKTGRSGCTQPRS
jgi:hypothetical protein